VGGCAGFGGPDDELLLGVGGGGERVPVEGEFADDGMVECLGADSDAGNVVGGPPLAELGVLDGQLSDEGGKATLKLLPRSTSR
jgi:hypothetical protein